MQVGDLIRMPGSIESTMSIILRTRSEDEARRDPNGCLGRVEVYWIADGESSWEPVKWLEVISEG